MTPEQLGAELTRTIESLDPAFTPEETADALLASPAIASIRAQAWDEGFSAGHRHARRTQ